jgi:undecaprenyl-phosphate galactose phosphotransferase
MVPNTDKKLKELLDSDPEKKKEWKKFQKLTHDPRITRVGKVIRHGSIDETPQFLNVLFGQLSMVGPRPLVDGEIEEHEGNAKLYQSVKPGITGWWAVNGRSEMDYESRLKLEYYYIKNRSIGIDMKIIIKTFGVLKTHEGAK